MKQEIVRKLDNARSCAQIFALCYDAGSVQRAFLMSDTSDLTVRVLDDRDIVVVMADTGFE
jgi:hypothetical protein